MPKVTRDEFAHCHVYFGKWLWCGPSVTCTHRTMQCFWKDSRGRDDFIAYNSEPMSLERPNHVGELARTFSQRLKTGALSNFTMFLRYNPFNTRINCNLKLWSSQSCSSHGRVVLPQWLCSHVQHRLAARVQKSLVFSQRSSAEVAISNNAARQWS